MKHPKLLVAALALFTLAGSASASCTFRWEHYGAPQTYKQISQQIANKVTDDYCAKYNKTHEIVFITDEYNDTSRTLVHVSVALRKRGSNILPVKRLSAYRFENGNFVIGKKYEMSAALALDTLLDVLSTPEDNLN